MMRSGNYKQWRYTSTQYPLNWIIALNVKYNTIFPQNTHCWATAKSIWPAVVMNKQGQIWAVGVQNIHIRILSVPKMASSKVPVSYIVLQLALSTRLLTYVHLSEQGLTASLPLAEHIAKCTWVLPLFNSLDTNSPMSGKEVKQSGDVSPSPTRSQGNLSSQLLQGFSLRV